MTPIESLLDLASRIEDFPEDVSVRDAVKTIRTATEELETWQTKAKQLLDKWLKDGNAAAWETIQFLRPAEQETDAP